MVSRKSEPFPILELSSDSPTVIEQLGSKRKFWFFMEGDEQPWLFKYTRENTGEDWSEKISSEIARLLAIPSATVELATFMDKRGCASRSFVETKKGFELVHGSEVLAGRVLNYEISKQWGQSDHCIKNIIAAVEETFSPRQRIQQLRTLAGFIVLDALICNTDRHHDNWGLLRSLTQRDKTMHSIAPSFDHASSLGRELKDERRKSKLVRPGIEQYILRAHGGIYWDVTDTKGDNPLRLAIKAAEAYPTYFAPCLNRLKRIEEEELTGIVERVPVKWMSKVAKEFCCCLLSTTLKALKGVDV